MTPLATTDDVKAKMPNQTLTPAQEARAQNLLVSASVKIRSHTKQDFTKAQTTEIIPPVDNQIILPQRPVVSVDAVGRVNPDGITVTQFALWTFDGLATILLGPPSTIVNAPEFWIENDWFWRNVTYSVQYTHGYDVIPEDVVDVCAEMVYRVLSAPTTSQGLDGEMLSGYSWRGDGTVPIGRVSLIDDDKDVLEKYCGRKNRTIELR